MVRAVFCGILALVLAGYCSARDYEGYALIQATPNTQDNSDFLSLLEENPGDFDVQIWSHGNTEMPFDVLVGPHSKDAFFAELTKRQIKYTIKNKNIQNSMNQETSANRFKRWGSKVTSKFMTNDEINTLIQSFAKDYPDLVQIEQIGTSHENRPIYVAKVSSNAGGSNKPSIWIDGGIHAREWIAISTVTYMLEKLVTTYATDAKIKNLVDKATWYISPVLNVDGYVYTHGGDRSWRKNRRPADKDCVGANCCAGVDLNRNFDYSFGGAGRTDEEVSATAKFPRSCQETYRGPEAFSEPESRAVRDFVLKHKSDMKAFISIHAYSQMWFIPFADKRQTYPADKDELVALSNKAVAAMEKPYKTKMRVGTPADIFYPAGGSSLDWVKAEAGVKYVFALELRPGSNTQGDGFVLPPTQIKPTGEETWAAMNVVADEVISKFGN